MTRTLWTLRLGAALVALTAVLAVLVIAQRSARGPSPASATTNLDPIHFNPAQPVRIVTDRYGIPHIHASSMDDLYFGWGYVTARDRLWQIAYSRQSARGALWKWFGNSKLRDDGGAQLFELETRARRIWERESNDPAAANPLRRFAAGINKYFSECRSGIHPWPRELTALGQTVDDWSPADTYLLLLAQGMVLDFAVPEFDEAEDIKRRGAAAVVARNRFEDALTYRSIPDTAAARLLGAKHDAPGTPLARSDDRNGRTTPHGANAAVVHSAPGTEVSGRTHSAPGIDVPARARAALGAWWSSASEDPDLRASNVFAAGAGRSASGAPLLANDPHLAFSAPGALHVVHLTVPGAIDAIGACVPGLPSIVSGRNCTAAWGLTALSADVIDVYADTLSHDGRSVRWQGGWAKLREAPFTMRYRLPGGLLIPTLGQTRRYSPHGPVLVHDRKQGVAFSARWACPDSAIRLGRLLGLARSTSAREIAERYREQVTPGLNIVAADITGQVIYKTVGTVPIRGFDPPRGVLPGDGRHEWQGMVAPEAMPAWQPPPHGFVVNGNNLPASAGRMESWPRFDFAHDRATRMSERLAGDPSLTLADIASVQNDVYSRGAARLVPRLLKAADANTAGLSPRARAALDTLRAWDFMARRNRVASTIFRAWYGALQRRSDLDGLQGLTAAALDGRAPEALVDAKGNREAPAVAAVAALDTALVRLDVLLGRDMSRWTWGRAHRARFRHALRLREAAFEPPTIAADGDNSTPCVGRSSLPWNVDFTHGPVYRHVVDLAHPDSSLGIVTPGNHGEGPHAADLAARWANHTYIPFLMNWQRIEAIRESEITLPGVR